VEESEMYPSLQSKVWYAIGVVEELVDMALETLIQYAIQNQLGSRGAEVAADTAVTLASANVELVAGKIVSRLRRALNKTSENPVPSIHQHPAWPEIAVLLRFALLLSFNDRLHVQQFLPELLYVVTMVISSGSMLIRSSVHGLVVNLVQSLCTSVTLPEGNMKTLSLLLSDLSEPKFRVLFGISRTALNAFSLGSESGEHSEKMSLSSLETIVGSLLQILDCGAVNPDLARSWSRRWTSLIANKALSPNPALQPRAFVTLGCLLKHDDTYDDMLLFQALLNMVDILQNHNLEKDFDLAVSIVIYLTQIVPIIPNESKLLKPMFWVAMSLIQIASVELFPSSLVLLETVLRTVFFIIFFLFFFFKRFLFCFVDLLVFVLPA